MPTVETCLSSEEGLKTPANQLNRACKSMPGIASWRCGRLLLPVTLVVILLSMLSAMSTCLHTCPISLAQMEWPPLIVALVLCVGYCLANATAWVYVLRELGYRLALEDGIGLWIGCEAFRWLPGSVWSLGVRSVEAAKRGVPVLITLATIALELLLSVVSRLLLITAVCVTYASTIRSAIADLPWQMVIAVSAGLLGTAGLGLLIFQSTSLGARYRNRMRELLHALADVPLRWSLLVSLLSYYLLIRILQGVALWFVVEGIVEGAQIPLGIVVAANAVAWILGFFAVLAPGGLIVREAVLATVLAPWLGPGQALAIAIAWRLLQIASESFLFAAVWLRFQWSGRSGWATVP